MNIGLFTDTYYPQINGVATSVLMLKENLEELGHEVYVFTTTDPKASGKEINVYRVPSIPFVSSRRLGMFYNHRLAKLIRRADLDIIHTHTEFSLGIFGREMARELKIPFLHTYHTIYEDYTHYIIKAVALESIAKMAARKISINFCNSANAVIVPTKKVEELLLSYGVKKNIFIIPTGIRLDKFSKYNYKYDKIQNLRTTLGIGANEKCLLYVGRVSKEKNIEEILIAMKFYLKYRKNVKFVIIGDGPEKSNLENMAKEIGIKQQTMFIGEKSWDEIGMYYQIGDAFISASQSETQGLTYIEALASGLPVVAKADECLEDVVQNDVNGYTFYNQEEFLQFLDFVLFDDLLRENLSRGAVRTVKKFSVLNFTYTVETLYKNIVLESKNYKNAYAKI